MTVLFDVSYQFYTSDLSASLHIHTRTCTGTVHVRTYMYIAFFIAFQCFCVEEDEVEVVVDNATSLSR